MNEEKTEEFTIKRNGEETWKKCQLLGMLLDTEEDLKRRKVLEMNVGNSMKETYFRDISIEAKIHSFNCYVGSVFLYNCEAWTLTKTLKNTIDSFRQRLLRIALPSAKWPDITTNDTVYAATRQIPWSQVITRRELEHVYMRTGVNSNRFEISLRDKISLRCEVTSLSAFTWLWAE